MVDEWVLLMVAGFVVADQFVVGGWVSGGGLVCSGCSG